MLTVTTSEPLEPELVVVMLHGHGMRATDLSPFAPSLKVPARFHHPQGPHELPDGTWAWWPRMARRAASAGEPRTEAAEVPRAEAAGAPAVDGSHGSASSGGLPARTLAAIRPVGSREARSDLARWLNDPTKVPSAARVVLAGFSQGGMLACDTALLEDVRFDGLALFSSAPIALDEWRPRLDRVAGKPVLVTHGLRDDELALSCGEALRDHLSAAGAAVDWLAFDGGHQMPLPVWRRFRRLLLNVNRSA